ncbi:MAG: glycosyltransferase family 2 protein [bacterium]
MNTSSAPVGGLAPTVTDCALPTVSVIIVTHGRPQLVAAALGAVLGQTYGGEMDCIVVHDKEEPRHELTGGATPGRRIRVVSNTHTPGLAGARNTGLDLAEGSFVATCDDDDVWHPTKLQRQVDLLMKRPDLLVVGSGLRFLLPDGKRADWPARSELIDRKLLLRNRVKELHSSTLVMRRDAFAKAGRYDETLPSGYAEDYDWVLRASRVGRIGAVTAPLADIRKDGQSYYKGRADRTVAGLEFFLQKHPEIAESRRGHARILGQIAFYRSSAGERSEGLRCAGKAFLRWPASPHVYLAAAQATTGIDAERFARMLRRFGRGTA